MTIIKEHQYAFMKTQNEILELEINGTAEYILKQNGISRYAELICEKCNLHTFQDLGNLTSEKIKSIELDLPQMHKLIALVINCCDENTYKIYRRQNCISKKLIGANRRNMKDLNNTKSKETNESNNGQHTQMKDHWTHIYRLSS